MRDILNTYDCLKMELEHLQELRKDIKKLGLSPSRVNTLDRHYEVLEKIVRSSAY